MRVIDYLSVHSLALRAFIFSEAQASFFALMQAILEDNKMGSRSHGKWLLWFFLSVVLGCSSPPEPDIYPPGKTVTLKMPLASPDPFTLGPKSSQLFLNMLATEPVRSDISSMPAAPMGVFTVDGNYCDWHGNGVIRVTNGEERLWHGPYTQRLMNDVMRREHDSSETMHAILDEIENDQSVESTRVTGPGQYPGGSNDALHQPAK